MGYELVVLASVVFIGWLLYRKYFQRVLAEGQIAASSFKSELEHGELPQEIVVGTLGQVARLAKERGELREVVDGRLNQWDSTKASMRAPTVGWTAFRLMLGKVLSGHLAGLERVIVIYKNEDISYILIDEEVLRSPSFSTTKLIEDCESKGVKVTKLDG